MGILRSNLYLVLDAWMIIIYSCGNKPKNYNNIHVSRKMLIWILAWNMDKWDNV